MAGIDEDWGGLSQVVTHLLLSWVHSCSLHGFLSESSHFSAAILFGARLEQNENEENRADDHAPLEKFVEVSVSSFAILVILISVGLLIILIERSVIPHLLGLFSGGESFGLMFGGGFFFWIGGMGSLEGVIHAVLLNSRVKNGITLHQVRRERDGVLRGGHGHGIFGRRRMRI